MLKKKIPPKPDFIVKPVRSNVFLVVTPCFQNFVSALYHFKKKKRKKVFFKELFLEKTIYNSGLKHSTVHIYTDVLQSTYQ